MSDHHHPEHGRPNLNPTTRRGARGQAIVEYALIAVLVCLGIAAVVTATGPTIGNIFSNTVYNLLGQKFTPNPTLSDTDIAKYATDIASITPPPPTYLTNTPLVPTCASGSNQGKWAFTLTPNPPGSDNGKGTWIPGEPSASCP
jgi:Flp pilus assembly pilin Flp